MNTLIINGSPRQNGDGKYIISKLIKELEGEVTVIDVYKESYSPCIDCRYCWTHTDCAIKDNMFKIYDSIETFDNIILSSPVYFSELSGPILSYTSRFQRYYAERYLMENHVFKMKAKKGALILTAGGDCRDINRPIETAEIILKHINTELVSMISTMDTNQTPASKDVHLTKQINTLTEMLNKNLL